jgi:hypothetical protein
MKPLATFVLILAVIAMMAYSIYQAVAVSGTVIQ